MSDHLVRVGARLFNLVHVTSIEPEEGGDGVDVHIVHGRVVRLRGDDARAARSLVDSFPCVPGEDPEGGEGTPFEVADDHGGPGEPGEDKNGLKALRP